MPPRRLALSLLAILLLGASVACNESDSDGNMTPALLPEGFSTDTATGSSSQEIYETYMSETNPTPSDVEEGADRFIRIETDSEVDPARP